MAKRTEYPVVLMTAAVTARDELRAVLPDLERTIGAMPAGPERGKLERVLQTMTACVDRLRLCLKGRRVLQNVA